MNAISFFYYLSGSHVSFMYWPIIPYTARAHEIYHESSLTLLYGPNYYETIELYVLPTVIW